MLEPSAENQVIVDIANDIVEKYGIETATIISQMIQIVFLTSINPPKSVRSEYLQVMSKAILDSSIEINQCEKGGVAKIGGIPIRDNIKKVFDSVKKDNETDTKAFIALPEYDNEIPEKDMNDKDIIEYADNIVQECGLNNAAKIGQALLALHFTAKSSNRDDLEKFLLGIQRAVNDIRNLIIATLEMDDE